MPRERVVYTDLDGTLLDPETYRPLESVRALAALRARGIPVVPCTSKTRTETEALRAELGLEDPYIVENGSAILGPDGYFPFPVGRSEGPVWRLELAAPLAAFLPRLRAALAEAAVRCESFLSLRDEEVAARTGLSLEGARRAREREYTVTLCFSEPEERDRARARLRAAGLTAFSGGRYLTVGDGGEKGRAVAELTALYRRAYGPIRTYAFGDGENDRSMLERVDVPILVQRAAGEWEPIDVPGLRRIPAVGPKGFARGVATVVSEGP